MFYITGVTFYFTWCFLVSSSNIKFAWRIKNENINLFYGWHNFISIQICHSSIIKMLKVDIVCVQRQRYTNLWFDIVLGLLLLKKTMISYSSSYRTSDPSDRGGRNWRERWLSPQRENWRKTGDSYQVVSSTEIKSLIQPLGVWRILYIVIVSFMFILQDYHWRKLQT